MKRVCDNISKCVSQERFLELPQQFADINISCDDYKIKLSDISDSEGISNFTDSIIDRFQIFFLLLFAIFMLHSRESELYRYTLDGKSALAWELPFLRFMGHLSST